MHQTTQGDEPKAFPGNALLSVICGLIATAWCRDFGNGAVNGLFAGFVLFLLAVVFTLGALTHRFAVHCLARILIIPIGIVLANAVGMDWVGLAGAYAIPRLPDLIGFAICAGAIILGCRSMVSRERIPSIAVAGILLGIYVSITCFAVDRVTNSPYYVVRQFASAAANKDDHTMMQLVTHASRKQFSKLTDYIVNDDFVLSSVAPLGLIRQGYSCGSTLRWLRTNGNRAIVDSSIPERWNVFGLAGHMGHIYLIREDNVWRIDAYRHWQEFESLKMGKYVHPDP